MPDAGEQRIGIGIKRRTVALIVAHFAMTIAAKWSQRIIVVQGGDKTSHWSAGFVLSAAE